MPDVLVQIAFETEHTPGRRSSAFRLADRFIEATVDRRPVRRRCGRLRRELRQHRVSDLFGDHRPDITQILADLPDLLYHPHQKLQVALQIAHWHVLVRRSG